MPFSHTFCIFSILLQQPNNYRLVELAKSTIHQYSMLPNYSMMCSCPYTVIILKKMFFLKLLRRFRPSLTWPQRPAFCNSKISQKYFMEACKAEKTLTPNFRIHPFFTGFDPNQKPEKAVLTLVMSITFAR